MSGFRYVACDRMHFQDVTVWEIWHTSLYIIAKVIHTTLVYLGKEAV